MWRQKSNLVDYRKVKSHVYGGRSYHSKGEAGYASELDLRVKAGEIKGYECQYKIPLVVNDYLVATYYADFRVFHNDGTEEIVETKGWFTDYARLKWRLFEAIYAKTHPDVLITMVKLKSKKWGKRKFKKR